MFIHIVSCVETRMQGKAHKILVVQEALKERMKMLTEYIQHAHGRWDMGQKGRCCGSSSPGILKQRELDTLSLASGSHSGG